MSKLEQLKKAVDDAREELQKARDAWDAAADSAYANAAVRAAAYAAWAAYDAALNAYLKAMQELKDYTMELNYE